MCQQSTNTFNTQLIARCRWFLGAALDILISLEPVDSVGANRLIIDSF